MDVTAAPLRLRYNALAGVTESRNDKPSKAATESVGGSDGCHDVSYGNGAPDGENWVILVKRAA